MMPNQMGKKAVAQVAKKPLITWAESINQGFFFSSITQQNHIKMHTCGQKRKESVTKRYTLKHAPIKGYKSNYLKMHSH